MASPMQKFVTIGSVCLTKFLESETMKVYVDGEFVGDLTEEQAEQLEKQLTDKPEWIKKLIG